MRHQSRFSKTTKHQAQNNLPNKRKSDRGPVPIPAMASASGHSPTVGPSPNLRGSSPLPDRSLSRLSSQDRVHGILEVRVHTAIAIGVRPVWGSPVKKEITYLPTQPIESPTLAYGHFNPANWHFLTEPLSLPERERTRRNDRLAESGTQSSEDELPAPAGARW